MGSRDNDNDIGNLSTTHKWLIILALGAGAGNGFVGLNQDTADRYKGAEAKADFAIRDAYIRGLEREFAAHRQLCAARAQEIKQHGEDLNELQDAVKDHIKEHLNGNRGH